MEIMFSTQATQLLNSKSNEFVKSYISEISTCAHCKSFKHETERIRNYFTNFYLLILLILTLFF